MARRPDAAGPIGDSRAGTDARRHHRRRLRRGVPAGARGARLKRLPLAIPDIGALEGEYLQACVESTFVSSGGPFVAAFERAFADFVGARHAVACASGTAAIHLALCALDIGDGDEVWVSDFTFIASANPIRYERAAPLFVDAEWATWNFDPDLAIAEIE